MQTEMGQPLSVKQDTKLTVLPIMRKNRFYQIKIRLLDCLAPPVIQQHFQVSADHGFLAFKVAVERSSADTGCLADLADRDIVEIIAFHQLQKSIGAFRKNNIHRQTAEMGYYLAEEYWGMDIMTEAIRQLCKIIFDTTDILRIYAEPFTYNTGSRRALEKAGFAFEGIMKNNAVKNGKVLDMALYSLTRTMEPYPVRRLTYEEIPQALELCWRVFLEFEAPEYSPEGIAAFRASLDDKERNRKMVFYGAFDGDALVGVLSMREPQHISGFFVDAAYHRRGIGRRLLEAMRRDYTRQVFTVNSSPYAVEVYRHLEFVPTSGEQTVDGLRFTPMQYSAKTAVSGI